MNTTETVATMEENLPPVEAAKAAGIEPGQIRLDVEQVFLLYTNFCGDVDATAAAVGVSPRVISALAVAEGWQHKIAHIIAKVKSRKPGDVERAINRALCFVQAFRYLKFLERVCRRMFNWTDSELHEYLVTWEMKGKGDEAVKIPKVNARALSDMAHALETAQQMCYFALNDTTPERSRRTETGQDELAASAFHAEITKAMDAAAKPTSVNGQLAEAQIERAQLDAGKTVLV
jgi:hypothetical protein